MARYKATYEVRSKSYVALFHTAWHLLDMAEKHSEGSLLNLPAATVFFAFAFEAYLNHVGAEELAFWEEIERISHTGKLAVISKHLALPVDKSARPFQTIGGLFQLRDALAHGRTETKTETKISNTKPDRDAVWRVLPREKLTTESVRRYYCDVRSAAEQINAARSVPDDSMWKEGYRKYRIKGSR